MAGPNLEVIRFGFYLFFPVAMMVKFGDPEWYNSYVVPYGQKLFPDFEKTNKPPHTSSEIHSELARMKSDRLEKKGLRSSEVAATESSVSPITAQAQSPTDSTGAGVQSRWV